MTDHLTGTPTALRIHPRSTVALLLAFLATVAAFGWPLLVSPDSGLAHGNDATLVFAVLLPLVLAVVLAELSEGGIDAKAVAMLGVLSAVGSAIRLLGAGTGGIEPVFFLIVLAGRVFGRGFGFVLGCTTLLASALLTGGVGPWLPFQMLGAAWVGFGAGCLPAVRGRWEIAVLAGYATLAALAYGVALNLSFWPFTLGGGTEISFVPGDPVADNLPRLLAFSLATSLGWDLMRAVTTVLLVVLAGPGVLFVLRRAARKARWAG
ncbi:ECF transporter S component [Nakamurella sp. YIM 132087]|uniref:ECF transporter S component n=1 Tax=Nakamurella alba TaxID=2665158 RepID=A0A7K1FQJ9_9ACTN|nr:ECF transporter S component [Nakamurella alba]MTD15639.1 ECF transporter S component [Nakamurella alba]